MTPDIVKFTKHALQRAKERKLWRFVNKKSFFFDAAYIDTNRSILENCVYVSKNIDGIIKILTMYPKA